MSTAFYPGLPFSYQYNSVQYVPQHPQQIVILVPQYIEPAPAVPEKELWNESTQPFFQPCLSACGELEIVPDCDEVPVASHLIVSQPRRSSTEPKDKGNNYIQIVDFESEEEPIPQPTFRSLAKGACQLKIIDEEEDDEQIETCSTAPAYSVEIRECKSIESEITDYKMMESVMEEPQAECEGWFSEISADVFA